jgi:hypothetical protein
LEFVALLFARLRLDISCHTPSRRCLPPNKQPPQGLALTPWPLIPNPYGVPGERSCSLGCLTPAFKPPPQIRRHLPMAAQTKRPQIIQVTLPTPLGHRTNMVRIPQRPPRRGPRRAFFARWGDCRHRPQPPNLQRRYPRPPPTPQQPRIRRHRIGPTQPANPLIPQKHLVPQIPRIRPQPPLVHAKLRAKRPPPFGQDLHPAPPAKRPPIRPHLARLSPNPPRLRQPPPRQPPRPLRSSHPLILTNPKPRHHPQIRVPHS